MIRFLAGKSPLAVSPASKSSFLFANKSLIQMIVVGEDLYPPGVVSWNAIPTVFLIVGNQTVRRAYLLLHAAPKSFGLLCRGDIFPPDVTYISLFTLWCLLTFPQNNVFLSLSSFLSLSLAPPLTLSYYEDCVSDADQRRCLSGFDIQFLKLLSRAITRAVAVSYPEI